ncbi:hypothetical protein R3P38DRAFT_3170518 [Favolaschia claudopus]|uniref:Uncharacterized protein n=1 Tax=Favolaschia claudopus TaxID=2862362 RepID=A0AAW0DX96_9AGAR
MPETIQAAYEMPEYLKWFLKSLRRHPDALKVIGFMCDYIAGEQEAMKQRVAQVIAFSQTMSSYSCDTPSTWAWKLYRRSLAVPDTHGLLIKACWENLPQYARKQVSPNHDNWERFRDALCNIKKNNSIVPTKIPPPWFTRTAPYTIVRNPAESGLPMRLNRFLPLMWRGAKGPRSNITNKEGRRFTECLFLDDFLNNDEQEDSVDVRVPLLELPTDYDDPPEIDELLFSKPELVYEAEEEDKNEEDEEDEEGEEEEDEIMVKEDEAEIRYGRYLWPQKLLGGVFSDPAYTEEEAFDAAGLYFHDVMYHPRRLVLDLRNACFEIHLLLHTSVQIYTYSQWERVSRVPQSVRGFKIGFALLLQRYVVAFLSADMNFRICWRTRRKMLELGLLSVPDPVLNYFDWCTWTADWLKLYTPRRRTQTSIYEWLTKSGVRHFAQGNGSFMTDELLARAGIPPSTRAFDVLNNPCLCCLLLDTHVQLLLEHAFHLDDQMHTARNYFKRNKQTEEDYAIYVTHQEQIDFGRKLWVHAKKQSRVSCRLASLLNEYNSLAQETHMNKDDVDMSSAVHPFDLANIRHVSLLWGRLVPYILGERWEDLVREEGDSALEGKGTNGFTFKSLLKRLPPETSELQRLTLTPITMLDADAKARLKEAYPINPIIEYFQTKAGADAEYKERQRAAREARAAAKKSGKKGLGKKLTKKDMHPTQQLHLAQFGLSQRISVATMFMQVKPQRRKISFPKCFAAPVFQMKYEDWHLAPEHHTQLVDTRLYRVGRSKRGKTAWTLENPSWPQFDSETRLKRTIEYIKTETKEFAVGWPDFCGNGEIIGYGNNNSFAALCRWDPALNERQQQLLDRHWEHRGVYDVGMRKLPLSQLDPERKWRASVKKQLQKEMRDVLDELLEEVGRVPDGGKRKRELEDDDIRKWLTEDGDLDMEKAIKGIRKKEREGTSGNKRRRLQSVI